MLNHATCYHRGVEQGFLALCNFSGAKTDQRSLHLLIQNMVINRIISTCVGNAAGNCARKREQTKRKKNIYIYTDSEKRCSQRKLF